jgi:hypothetical protein
MGYKSHEIKVMTLRDFRRAHEGYLRRQDHDWDILRNLSAEIRSCAFGSKKAYRGKDIMVLPRIDNAYSDKKVHIKTIEEAIKLFKSF